MTGHVAKKRPRKPEMVAYQLGALTVNVRRGSVFDPNDVQAIPPGQKFRITVIFGDGAEIYRKGKNVAAPYSATFTNVPVGRHIVVVENVSDVPATPGAVAEVTVAPRVSAQWQGKVVESPPTSIDVKVATNTPGEIASHCGFRVGALEGVPERTGVGLRSAYPAYFNARVNLVFWNPSIVGHVPAPPVAGNQSFVVFPTGPNQGPERRTTWDGIPTDPGFGAPSLLSSSPPQDVPLAVPANLVSVREDQGFSPILSGGREILGLVQAEKEGRPEGVPYNSTDNRLQITFVRQKEGGAPYELEVVPPEDAPKTGIRYYRHSPPLAATQHTALVWKSGNCAPPPRIPATVVKAALIREAARYCEDVIHVHKHDPGARQFVVVNEALIGQLGESKLRPKPKSAREKRELAKVDKLVAAQEKGGKALYKAIVRARIGEAAIDRWLAQEEPREASYWLYRIDRSIGYIVACFLAAAPADPDAALILNEHSLEALSKRKALAHAVLTHAVKQALRKKGAAGANAAKRLAVGFQMHLNEHYYDTKKKPDASKRFLASLGESMRLYEAMKTRVYVTEMGLRMPGFGGFERSVERLQVAFSLSSLIDQVLAHDYATGPFPNGAHYRVATVTEKKKEGDKEIVSVRPVSIAFDGPTRKKSSSKKKDEAPPKTITLSLDTGAVTADGHGSKGTVKPVAGQAITVDTIAHWENAGRKAGTPWNNQELGEHLRSALQGTQYVNPNAWPGYGARADQAVPKVTGKQLRQQADLFYKIVRTCLSSRVCDDLNFWAVVDSSGNDKQDLFGFLFGRAQDPGAPTDGIPYKRKPAYFAVVQGLVEAAIAKGRGGIQGHAKALGRTALTRGDHAYEAHLRPTW